MRTQQQADLRACASTDVPSGARIRIRCTLHAGRGPARGHRLQCSPQARAPPARKVAGPVRCGSLSRQSLRPGAKAGCSPQAAGVERWDRVRGPRAVSKRTLTLSTAAPHSGCDPGKALSTLCILSLTSGKQADGRTERPDSKGVSCRARTCGLDPTVPFLQSPPWPYREETTLGTAQGCGHVERRGWGQGRSPPWSRPEQPGVSPQFGASSTDQESQCVQPAGGPVTLSDSQRLSPGRPPGREST